MVYTKIELVLELWCKRQFPIHKFFIRYHKSGMMILYYTYIHSGQLTIYIISQMKCYRKCLFLFQ